MQEQATYEPIDVNAVYKQDVQSRTVLLLARLARMDCSKAGKRRCKESGRTVCPPCEARFIAKEAERVSAAIAEQKSKAETEKAVAGIEATAHIIVQNIDNECRGDVTRVRKTISSIDGPIEMLVEWHDDGKGDGVWCDPHNFECIKGDDDFIELCQQALQ